MIFRTKGSLYLYSKKHNKILLLHPTLADIIRQEEKPGRKETKYYYKKYQLLKENGYFDRTDPAQRISGRYTGKDIENHLHDNGHLVFEATARCNQKCTYCYYGDLYSGYSHRENHYPDTKKAKALFNYMVERWNSPKNRFYNKEIRIGFYGGEPLLNFSFIEEMIRCAQKTPLKHNYFTFGLTTNGTLLDKYAEYLVENRVHILVSLDGDEKSNGFRVFQDGSAVYETVYNNVLNLRSRFPGYFEEYVNFAAVLHRLNSLEGILDFFKTNFNKTPHLTQVSLSGVKDEKREIVNKMFVDISDSFNQAKNRKQLQDNLIFQVPPVNRLTKLLYNYSDDTFKNLEDILINIQAGHTPTGSCVPLQRRIFLTTDGSILPCERVAHRHILGRVTGDGVAIDFDKIAETYNRFFDGLADQCRHCFAVQDCQNCILQMEAGEEGCRCPAFKDQPQFENFLSGTVAFLEENPSLYKKISKELFLE